jgi:hypothetical protein
MTNVPNFRDYCEAACIKLWGEPDRRTAKELHWNGSNGYDGKTFDRKKRVWFDRGENWGGSTLDLVAHHKGLPKQELKKAAFYDAWRAAHELGIVPDPAPEPNGQAGPILATYPYHDENSGLLFEVVRFDTADHDKRFRQRRPDGNGGWIWDTKGVRTHVLYRLPALIEAVQAGQRVLICEGEKDANTAVALGYAATTMPGGVGKWHGEYDSFFQGADVVIVSDNDEQAKDKQTGALKFHPDGHPVLPGQDHAAKVAKHLRKVAEHVRTIIFPQKDLTTWGGTKADLDAIIEAAPDLNAAPEPAPVVSDEEAQAILAELNRDNAVVLDGGKAMVLRFEDVPHDADGEHYVYQLPTFLKFADFRNFYLNRYTTVAVGDKIKTVSIGHWWLSHPDRRQYAGVVFVPAGEPIIDGKLNLWRGWGVEPKQGDWHLLREHIQKVLAAGDVAMDQYIFKWLAWAVQHPAERAEVALVFRGAIGSGKGTLGNAMCRIFGQHARHRSSPDHMTGRFNAHLRQCCFLFGDECCGPKNKSAEGTLKRLITEPTLTIEPKGRDTIEVPNRLHSMLASNHDWVVPAGARERRYAVQDVDESKVQDAGWFKPIYQEMRSGGLEAMLYDLLHYPLGDWHPRQIFRTKALSRQQEQSLEALDQLWLELLQTGVLTGASEAAPDKAIVNHYEEEITETEGFTKRTRTVKREGLYDQARQVSPRLKGASDHALGHYLREQGCMSVWISGGDRTRRGWSLPTLEKCRERWKERFPATVWLDPKVCKWAF